LSALALLFTLSRADLPALVTAAGEGTSQDFIDAHGTELGDYLWSGYVFMHAMSYLENLGTFLGTEYPAEETALAADAELVYLLTPAAFRSLDELDPSRLDETAFGAYLEEMDLGFEESGLAGQDTMELLSTSLHNLPDDQILLLMIG
jgi:hypothetical protein